jgi:hypothetical protein
MADYFPRDVYGRIVVGIYPPEKNFWHRESWAAHVWGYAELITVKGSSAEEAARLAVEQLGNDLAWDGEGENPLGWPRAEWEKP